eukprot:m.88080 g.88080  ORF g.88080 m.88080 type:complete len:540 (-) comp12853_c0_seq3:628-2247(-)
MAKKKSAKAKKPALTEEERALLMEQEASQKAVEDAKRKAIATRFLKEKLAQEQKNTRISTLKINARWRSIMRQEKATELRREIDILIQSFERVLDRKEAVVKSCLKDMEEAEQQTQLATRSHVHNIDRLVAFQESVLSKLHDDFQSTLEEIRQEFMSERQFILESHGKEMNALKDMAYSFQMSAEDKAEQAETEFSSRRDDLRTKNLDARTSLKATLETNVKELWDMFQQALAQYEASTSEKKAEFERLKERDRKAAATIERQMRKIQHLMDKIQSCKAKIAQNARGNTGRNSELRREKESVLKQVHQLKVSLKRGRARDQRALVKITQEGKACREKLEKKLDAAKQVLSLSEVCSRLETEEEKVLPFYKETVSQQEVDEEMQAAIERGELVLEEDGEVPVAASAEAEVPVDQHVGGYHPQPGPTELSAVAYSRQNQPVETFKALDNFYKRYNKVLLEKLALDREVSDLEEENEELRHILKQYLEGLSVSQDVLDQNNTLLVVNSRTNAPLNVPMSDGRVQVARPTVVDAREAYRTGVR